MPPSIAIKAAMAILAALWGVVAVFIGSIAIIVVIWIKVFGPTDGSWMQKVESVEAAARRAVIIGCIKYREVPHRTGYSSAADFRCVEWADGFKLEINN